MHQGDGHSLLRPEYVESLFVLWRATGNQTYRDWGWDVAAGVERAARVPTGGYASVADVGAAQPALRDHMESFFLAETLKCGGGGARRGARWAWGARATASDDPPPTFPPQVPVAAV